MAPPIAYILEMYPRSSEIFVLSELLELERQGVDLHVFSLERPDDGVFHAEVSQLHAPVTYLPEPTLLNLAAFEPAHRELFALDRARYLDVLMAAGGRGCLATLKRFLQAGYIAPFLRREGVAHIHAHFASGAAAVALHLHRLTGIPYSFTAHAKDIYGNSVDRGELVQKLHSARFAVTGSDYNRRYLAGLANGGRLVRIYNGLDLDRFAPNGSTREDPPLVLAVGRLIETKGFDDLIRACALLLRDDVPFRCQIVGKGELARNLCDLIGEFGLAGFVHLKEPPPREALVDVYSRASVLAAPSLVGSDGSLDGLPTGLIEAMTLGVPVVSTDVTGIPELVTDGRTGLVVPERDPAALAAAIRRILEDPELGANLARTARRLVEREFDLGANVAELRDLFAESSAT